jgi:hypothetical protein
MRLSLCLLRCRPVLESADAADELRLGIVEFGSEVSPALEWFHRAEFLHSSFNYRMRASDIVGDYGIDKKRDDMV